MNESKPYFYETEIEWKGERDLQLSSGKLPVIEAGVPPEFKGREETGRRSISLSLRSTAVTH